MVDETLLLGGTFRGASIAIAGVESNCQAQTMLIDGPALRDRIFADVERMAAANGGSVSGKDLGSYSIDGEALRLVDPQTRGIRNPRSLDATLSVRTTLKSPYSDGDYRTGVWEYHYQANSVDGDNRKLRLAKDMGLEIIYFDEVTPGRYLPLCHVRVIGDNYPARETFTLALASLASLPSVAEDTPLERAYREQVVLQRIHQPKFRARVLSAYAMQCTVCRLKYPDLLDAAHIVGDKETWGDAAVRNGMAMCKIHHAAYDRNFLGVSPKYQIEINKRLLADQDGPMLLHGLQEMHGQPITLPAHASQHPDVERLELRFREFQSA